MRAEPSHKSEMVNQVLFGELFRLLETYNNGWLKISLHHDDYEGWIPANSYTPITGKDFKALIKKNALISGKPLIQIEDVNDHTKMLLPAGGIINMFEDNSFYAGNKRFKFSKGEKPILIDKKNKPVNISSAAEMFLGSPYLWGGKSILGIDCSGLVQIAARIAGYNLPRDASQQIMHGAIVDFISEANTGDLAFFEDNEGNIVHTGIINKDGDIIHAHAFVRIDGIDHNGIYNKVNCSYSHKLRLIKRIC